MSAGIKYLPDLMNAYYGSGNWSQRTAPGVGSDIGPALVAGLSALRSEVGRGTAYITPGAWLLNNPPSLSQYAGHNILGYGSQASVIFYNNPGGIAIGSNGASGFTGGSIKGIGLLLESGLGDTNAYGILLRGDSVSQPDQYEIEDVYVSAAGGLSYWWNALEVDGSARSSPQGQRVLAAENVQLFNWRNIGAYFRNVVQCSIDNLGAYTGKGPVGVLMTDGSKQITAMNVTASGKPWHIIGCADVFAQGKASSLVTTNTININSFVYP